MHKPYADVDWESVERLHSVSHEHTFAPNTGGDEWSDGEMGWTPQGVFDSLYDRGIRHFALSNYHPSKPTYPLSAFFDRIPDDALGCPNAEHTGPTGHYCGLGSTYESATGEPTSSWSGLFDGILDALWDELGGGIVINHPRRTGITGDELAERLAYDERVLGIEVWNHRGIVRDKYQSRGNALALWDELLTAGRPVLGFFGADYHARWDADQWGRSARGRNVLLVPANTEREALRAYRDGRFYGALDGSGLRFERIELTDGELLVETSERSCIEFVTAGQPVATAHGRVARYQPSATDTYVRVTASDTAGEHLYSQPIVF